MKGVQTIVLQWRLLYVRYLQVLLTLLVVYCVTNCCFTLMTHSEGKTSPKYATKDMNETRFGYFRQFS